MKNNGKGVQQKIKFTNLLCRALLLFTFCYTLPATAENLLSDSAAQSNNSQRHHVFIFYTPESSLQTNISHQLSADLNYEHPELIVSKITPEDNTTPINNDTDMIIAIGAESIKRAINNHPEAKKLYISTAPTNYQLDKKEESAVLYMTQPYCRQIRFIKSLNTQWKTISIIYSQKKPIARKSIRQCANSLGVKVYLVSTSEKENLTNKIKHALQHSDVLLALPDSNIYNSKTVKNILLTSYRYRKPVIAFSKNFVNAGALASINSNTNQIVDAAYLITEQFFNADMKFSNAVHYPKEFNLNINRQVFRALDLSIPDLDKMMLTLDNNDLENPGKQQ